MFRRIGRVHQYWSARRARRQRKGVHHRAGLAAAAADEHAKRGKRGEKRKTRIERASSGSQPVTRAYLSVPVHALRPRLRRASLVTAPRPIARRRRPIPRRRASVSSGANCSRAPPFAFDDDRRTRPARRGDAATVGPRLARAPPPDPRGVRAGPHPRARVRDLAAAVVLLLPSPAFVRRDDVPEDDRPSLDPEYRYLCPVVSLGLKYVRMSV